MIKNGIENISNRARQTEEKISNLDNRNMEIMQLEED